MNQTYGASTQSVTACWANSTSWSQWVAEMSFDNVRSTEINGMDLAKTVWSGLAIHHNLFIDWWAKMTTSECPHTGSGLNCNWPHNWVGWCQTQVKEWLLLVFLLLTSYKIIPAPHCKLVTLFVQQAVTDCVEAPLLTQHKQWLALHHPSS